MAAPDFHRPRQASSLSPRQQFQIQVRTLRTDNSSRRHRRSKSISLKYNPYEQEHSSTLRVQTNVLRSSRSPARSSVDPLEGVQEEPDFIREERLAWSRRSPGTGSRRTGRASTSHFSLRDAADSRSELQRSKHGLQPFAPLQLSARPSHRPKTRHGLAETDTTTNKDEHRPISNASLVASKFVEGSMTSRSQALASTWPPQTSDCDASGSEAEDSELTPRASVHQSSSSLDLVDFDPSSSTSCATRRTLFRKKGGGKALAPSSIRPKEEKETRGKQQPEKTGRLRLRKSLSSWSLHSIGEKIGLFHDSSSNANESDLEESVAASSCTEITKSVLDERKRKAQIAYAQQFGNKKQKDNCGEATAVINQLPADSQFTSNIQASIASDPDATIRVRSGLRSRRKSLGAPDCSSIFRVDGDDIYDARKRPSRRELEKENQHLRAILRQSRVTAQSFVVSAPASNYALQQKAVVTQDFSTSAGLASVSGTPSLRRSSDRPTLDSVRDITTPRIPSYSGNSEVVARSTAYERVQVGLTPQNTSLAGPSAYSSLPSTPRSVGMIIEEPEPEANEAQWLPRPTHIVSSRNVETRRRRHSAVCTAAENKAVNAGQENKSLTFVATIPMITVDSMMDESQAIPQKWQGWDEDVF